jgi:D-alanyl-D-alanine carboxypeptidase
MEEHVPEDDEDRQGGRRRRQRLVQRRDRERELRRTWLILGGSALAALLVLFLIIHTVIGLLHKSKPGPADAGTQTASAQEESAEGQAQDSAGTEQNPDAASAPAAETGAEGADEQAEGSEAPAEPDEAQPTDGQTGTETEAGTETGAAAGAEPQTAEQQPGTETQTASGETPAETPGTPAETPEEGTESVQTSPDAAAQAEAGAGTQVTASDVSGVSYSGQDDWRLILVNPWHHLPENYTVETTTLTNGESVDSRCYQALMDMLEDCRAAGGTPIVCSSYRPHEKQVSLFEDQVKPLMASGMTREEAEKEAGTVVAVPGTSEHELGLAVDICDTNNQLLDASQADTQTQKWLMAHCYDYGFILRYPEDKVDVTGIIYEPWHYRYVGAEAAARIRDRGICLEEYLTQN